MSTPLQHFDLRLCSVTPSDVLLWALLWLNENTSFSTRAAQDDEAPKHGARDLDVRDFYYSGTAKSKLDLIAARETAISRPILSELSFKA